MSRDPVSWVIQRKDVYRKISKQVKVGSTIYDSISAAARALRIEPVYLSKIIKTKGELKDGTKVSFTK